MRSSGVEQASWPLALRHASEARFREQMRCLGIPSPELLPFGMHGVGKKKVWHNRYESWKYPMTKIRILGPASDMSTWVLRAGHRDGPFHAVYGGEDPSGSGQASDSW